ncbi:molybdopterin adenylyltransferase [Spartobacteria bacterium LR76]|nr:molybdopterin adenylyltransferase [Spartobacteria bacterium LR76]
MIVGRVTLSDRASAGVYEDLSGPEIERVFSSAWGKPVEFVARVFPDERQMLATALREFCDDLKLPLVITTGGTGPSVRDVTPEATRDVVEKELPGFGEAMRMLSFPTVPTAILSRALAGIRGRTIILNLPGNPRSISQCLPPLVPALREGLRHLGHELDQAS